MLQKPEYRAKRACGNMAANFHTVYNMLRRTDRSSDNLRTETIVCIHIDNVCHQCQAVAADIIQASDKRRSVSSARLSGQQGLSLPENKRAVSSDALFGESFYRAYTIFRTRYFDYYLFVERR